MPLPRPEGVVVVVVAALQVVAAKAEGVGGAPPLQQPPRPPKRLQQWRASLSGLNRWQQQRRRRQHHHHRHHRATHCLPAPLSPLRRARVGGLQRRRIGRRRRTPRTHDMRLLPSPPQRRWGMQRRGVSAGGQPPRHQLRQPSLPLLFWAVSLCPPCIMEWAATWTRGFKWKISQLPSLPLPPLEYYPLPLSTQRQRLSRARLNYSAARGPAACTSSTVVLPPPPAVPPPPHWTPYWPP